MNKTRDEREDAERDADLKEEAADDKFHADQERKAFDKVIENAQEVQEKDEAETMDIRTARLEEFIYNKLIKGKLLALLNETGFKIS